MTLYCSFNSHIEACTAIGNVAEQSGVQLFQRPWNFYEPDTTAWWLIPSKEWPAYRHGKFLFDKVEGQSNSIICGLYMEKGLGSELSDIYTSPSERRCIMETDWAWFRLLNNLQSGKARETIKRISSAIDSPIELRIDTSYVVSLQSFDPYEPSFHSDTYRFQLQSGSNTLNLVDSNIGSHLLAILSSVSTIGDLSRALGELNKNPWLWIDVSITLQFRNNPPSNVTPDNIWNAGSVWNRFLCNFLSWL